jgi:RNA recognition motif. (a.k.a. RRM, RBD, or RNP domain)
LKTIEHRVEFTWAKKKKRNGSHKLSTHVFWNGRDITHLVRKREYGAGPETTLEFSWSIRGGETIMIFVNFSASVTSERDRYVLFVDGDTFTNFPTLRDLDESLHDSTIHMTMEDRRSPENDACCAREGGEADHPLQSSIENSSDCSLHLSMEYPRAIAPGTEMGFRLAMAGLDRQFTLEDTKRNHEIKDELHSDLFSPVLESVREQITSYLPQADDVVSRAITNAFCAEDSSCSLGSSDTTSISLMSNEGKDALSIEANMLRDAYSWSNKVKASEANDDLDCARLEFLQRRIDELFLGIRNDCLEPEEVARIALNVAAQTGLRMTKPLPARTILINGIPQGTSEGELLLAFSRFGEMDSVAIASTRQFGFCRFARPETARLALEAYNHEDQRMVLNKNGEQPPDDGPTITLLESRVVDS